jgi:hypothetical protein
MEGSIPYRDLWDKKGPLLFLRYTSEEKPSVFMVTSEIAALLELCKLIDEGYRFVGQVKFAKLYLPLDKAATGGRHSGMNGQKEREARFRPALCNCFGEAWCGQLWNTGQGINPCDRGAVKTVRLR